MTDKIFTVGEEVGKPVAIINSLTGDVVAYIPNGKTQCFTTENECEPCTEKDIKLAAVIAALLNEKVGSLVWSETTCWQKDALKPVPVADAVERMLR
jgi:hypothetical protein